ncbi:MAG: protein-disulfide reductase DsbD domain-containing protein, partial [Psychromonas sp.]
MSTLRQFGLSFILLFSLINSAFAQAPETGWITNFNHLPVKVNLQLTGQVEQNTVNGILNVSLASGWKTYWRSPGEGGVAPTFDWSAQSANINEFNWSWPTPKRYPVLGVETVGYKDQIHFPVQISVDEINKVSRLKGTLTLASCTTICVLTDYEINLTFDPQQLTINDDVAFSYAQAVSSVPILVEQSAIEAQKNNANITDIKSSWDQENQQVVVQLSHQLDWQQPDLFIDSSEATLENVFFSKPMIDVSGKQLTATFEATSWGGEVDLSDAQVNVTVVDTDIAVEVATTLGTQPILSAGDSILSIFFIALLGGLILNIMPCVLP